MHTSSHQYSYSLSPDDTSSSLSNQGSSPVNKTKIPPQKRLSVSSKALQDLAAKRGSVLQAHQQHIVTSRIGGGIRPVQTSLKKEQTDAGFTYSPQSNQDTREGFHEPL
jgi:hypothetical protein